MGEDKQADQKHAPANKAPGVHWQQIRQVGRKPMYAMYTQPMHCLMYNFRLGATMMHYELRSTAALHLMRCTPP